MKPIQAYPKAVIQKWDSMIVTERAALLYGSDPSMKQARWADLVRRMSEASWEQLTPIQKDGVSSLL